MKRWIPAGLLFATATLCAFGQAASNGPSPASSASENLAIRRAQAEEALSRCRAAIAQEEKTIQEARERLRRLREKALMLEGAVAAFREAENLAGAETASATAIRSETPDKESKAK